MLIIQSVNSSIFFNLDYLHEKKFSGYFQTVGSQFEFCSCKIGRTFFSKNANFLPVSRISFFVQHLLECFCEWRKRSKDQIDESRISQWAAAQCTRIRKKLQFKNSWNQIKQFHEKIFGQILFFAISKMTKNQFLNKEKI